MKCISKNPRSGKDYWIEDYNPEQREALLEIGFIEKLVGEAAKSFGCKDRLVYTGTEVFGSWNEAETDMIDAVVFALVKEVTIYQMEMD